jgi:hypothetical protein
MIAYLKSDVKLQVPFQLLEFSITKEEIDVLLSYIKDPKIQHLLTPDSSRSEEFYGSNYIRLVNGCINPTENNETNWNNFFDWLKIKPTTEHRNFYYNVRDLVIPFASKMMTSLDSYTNQKHYTHGVEINTVFPGTEIKRHVDSHNLTKETHRIHLVLETNENSYMICNNEKRHFPVGSCFIFNNLMWHSVHNDGASPRTHLVIDFLTLA